MATKAARLDELTTALQAPVRELVDIAHVMDTTGGDPSRLQAELQAGVRDLVVAILDTDSADEILGAEVRVRGTVDTYRDLAEAVSD